MAQSIEVPLSPKEVKLTQAWLDTNKSSLPKGIYKNIMIALKCCEAIDELKLKIKDMIVLLTQYMGISSKSERGHKSKHFWGLR